MASRSRSTATSHPDRSPCSSGPARRDPSASPGAGARPWRRRPTRVRRGPPLADGSRAHLPPALAAVVVLVVDHIAGLLQHRAGPAHAVVAVVAVVLQPVPEEETARRTVVKVDAEHVLAMRDVEPEVRRLLQQRVPPVLEHAGNALVADEVARMPLAVVVDRLVPVLAHQRMAADALQPAEGPLVVGAEIVAADHDRASLMAAISCGGNAAAAGRRCAGRRRCRPAAAWSGRPLPPGPCRGCNSAGSIPARSPGRRP
jgi:hypothetical protein